MSLPSKTYVVPDIHGMYGLLRKAMAWIEQQEAGRVIFLGDYIDRGPQSAQVVAFLREGPKKGGWTWDFIRGNHEDMPLMVAENPAREGWWVRNGGGATVTSYGGVIPREDMMWFDSLPRLLWDEHRVYVHAAVDELNPLDAQDPETTQWHRYDEGADVGYYSRHVVHGHTIKVKGPELYKNRTNLDVGAFHTGRFLVAVFDDNKAGGPVHIEEFNDED